jgi:hypothetical protein
MQLIDLTKDEWRFEWFILFEIYKNMAFFLILNFLFKINLLIFLNYIDVKNNFFKIKNYFNIL